MRKEKIYLDTSVISYLDQQDSPEKMQETHIFWDMLKLGSYEVYISGIALFEISRNILEKKQKLFRYISQIDHIAINETQKSETLAEKYIEYAVLTEKSLIDCRHIALASIHECDYIASWNFKHMANINTMRKVQAVNILEGYKEVRIYPPTEFLQGQ